MEALRERGILRQNAPHLVHDLAFIVPNYAWWETPFYGIGMRVYDMLAGKYGFGKSRILSLDEVLAHIPTLERDGLRGGVLYYDGQFDDARLLIDLAQTAEQHGASLLNYAPVTALLHDAEGYACGARFRDLETNSEHEIRARAIINATGAFCDAIRAMDEPAAPRMIAPSQGVHVVLPRHFLPGDAAIMVPRTSDGRVMFAIPWHNHTLLGTTDVAVSEASLEPLPSDAEIDFLLETAARYLTRNPTRADILSAFAGIRPLVKADNHSGTAALSREHTIHISKSGLLTIAGGKWTTYRAMAEDCINHAIPIAHLEDRPSVTKNLPIYASATHEVLDLVRAGDDLAAPLHEALPICGAEVIWAVRQEMALHIEDVLSRRTRALMLNARAAVAMAPQVARLMARELKRGETWEQQQVEAFVRVASSYIVGEK
jgi:glycerol-3-phosphate dehydrogenase